MNTISDGVTTIDVPIVDGYQGSSEAKTLEHETLTGGMNYTLRPAAPQKGTLRCVLADDGDAASLYELARAGSPTLTFTSDRAGVGMDFVVAGGDVTRELDSATVAAWVIQIPYRELP